MISEKLVIDGLYPVGGKSRRVGVKTGASGRLICAALGFPVKWRA